MQLKAFGSVNEVVSQIRGLLESGALFRALDYEVQVHGFNFAVTNYFKLPSEITRSCVRCNLVTLWNTNNPSIQVGNPFQIRTYSCKNCGKSTVHFAVIWWTDLKASASFEKFGEYPKPDIAIQKLLEDRLGKSDASLYRRALISANISHGLAAVCYARRVIENKVDDLLDLVAEAARLEGEDNPLLAQLQAIKGGKQVDRKIELASQLLPKHLKPGGHNPLSTLYSNLSEALHSFTEEKCLERFEEFRFVFEYLFRNLVTENAEAADFAKRFAAKASQTSTTGKSD